ncbi:MAG: hypothetical protein U9Q74_09070 [Gemmatimonadota bacterium]|nr:hypothetical protein [Gemmatimonadota bacterium]
MPGHAAARISLGVLLVAGLAAGGRPARAQSGQQDRPSLTIRLPDDSLLARRGPLVAATHMLAGERLQQLLEAGFPARFHFRVELWSEGRFVFDQLEHIAEWDVLARWLPAERVYEVIQVQDDRALSLGRFAEIANAERAIGRPNMAPLAARRQSRPQYYQATLVVEVLSERDLDEVSRWLQGDVEPGITGRTNPASALSRAVRSLASRLLGGVRLEYEATTPHFRVP